MLPSSFLAYVPQDPFETEYNVARCVTKDGLYTVSLAVFFLFMSLI